MSLRVARTKAKIIFLDWRVLGLCASKGMTYEIHGMMVLFALSNEDNTEGVI